MIRKEGKKHLFVKWANSYILLEEINDKLKELLLEQKGGNND